MGPPDDVSALPAASPAAERDSAAAPDARARGGARPFVPRLLRTSAFRYTFLYFVIFIVSLAGIGYVVFASTLNATLRRIDRELVDELNYLAQINASQGADGWAGLNAVVNEVARLKVVHRDALYVVLVGPPFRELTNDLGELPPAALNATGMFRFEYDARVLDPATGLIDTEKRPAVGRRGNFLYAGVDGHNVSAILVTGRDISEIDEISDAARIIAARVGFFAPFLALVLGGLFSTTVLRRVDRIGQAVKAITEGDLTRRVPSRGSQDEFDTLSAAINAMLDQIERLMSGMRQVSDNIAHDLRSPLTRIKARLDAALSHPDADLPAVLDQTTTEVERLLATFNALLSITRIESGEGGGDQAVVDLRAVAEEMLELYEPAAADEGVELDAVFTGTPLLNGSRELISQAIANLLDNALKYGRHPAERDVAPRITMTVAALPNGGALLSVEDNGPGVPELDRERILQRFVRLERSRSTQGNGLGLSLVAAIARRHGGDIAVGNGLPHTSRAGAAARLRASDYGLGVRVTFPPPQRPARRPIADRQP